MVMHGDTVVYNADAFQLAEGSMLDALVERLPGVELRDNGVITHNGRPVSELLVNGKDFFRGDPTVALDNLPPYMVDKVKVYVRTTAYHQHFVPYSVIRPPGDGCESEKGVFRRLDSQCRGGLRLGPSLLGPCVRLRLHAENTHGPFRQL